MEKHVTNQNPVDNFEGTLSNLKSGHVSQIIPRKRVELRSDKLGSK